MIWRTWSIRRVSRSSLIEWVVCWLIRIEFGSETIYIVLIVDGVLCVRMSCERRSSLSTKTYLLTQNLSHRLTLTHFQSSLLQAKWQHLETNIWTWRTSPERWWLDTGEGGSDNRESVHQVSRIPFCPLTLCALVSTNVNVSIIVLVFNDVNLLWWCEWDVDVQWGCVCEWLCDVVKGCAFEWLMFGKAAYGTTCSKWSVCACARMCPCMYGDEVEKEVGIELCKS